MIMSLIKRNPPEVGFWRGELPFSRNLQRLQEEMSRMFDHFFHGNIFDDGTSFTHSWVPAVDVHETEDAYVVTVELPGLKKSDVKVTVDNNVLTIRGEKKDERESKTVNAHRVERSYGLFERSLPLPASVKTGDVDARFDDGVLTVTLPKTEEAKQKLIEVNVK
ncbi:MAG: Hsp20/alpha crystallin family protein [Bacteroidota bacterium]|nr:Hsp20/alpha crystallin family protein [Bacteroidota bacterium]